MNEKLELTHYNQGFRNLADTVESVGTKPMCHLAWLAFFFFVVVKEIYLSIYLFYVFECFVYTHHFHACCPGVLDEGIRFPRKGVTDGVDSGVQAL